MSNCGLWPFSLCDGEGGGGTVSSKVGELVLTSKQILKSVSVEKIGYKIIQMGGSADIWENQDIYTIHLIKEKIMNILN